VAMRGLAGAGWELAAISGGTCAGCGVASTVNHLTRVEASDPCGTASDVI